MKGLRYVGTCNRVDAGLKITQAVFNLAIITNKPRPVNLPIGEFAFTRNLVLIKPISFRI